MQGFMCCCSIDQGTEVTTKTYTEEIAQVVDGSISSSPPADEVKFELSQPAEDAAIPQAPVTADPTLSSAVSEINKGNPQEEKARLREIVTSFGKRAGAGLPCTYLGESGEHRVAAKFHVDKELRNYWVASAEGDGKLIAPVLALDQMLSAQSPKQDAIITALTDEEVKRAVLILHNAAMGDTPHGQIVLLEETAELAKTFMEGMKVLNVYAKRPKK